MEAGASCCGLGVDDVEDAGSFGSPPQPARVRAQAARRRQAMTLTPSNTELDEARVPP
jgi:hypothetical protein